MKIGTPQNPKLTQGEAEAMLAQLAPSSGPNPNPNPGPAPSTNFPDSWGNPPDMQTMDHVALPPVPDDLADQGYSWPSHGSSTLSNWITSNIDASVPPNDAPASPEIIQQLLDLAGGNFSLLMQIGTPQNPKLTQAEAEAMLAQLAPSSGPNPDPNPGPAPSTNFPDSWGSPPKIQTSDHVALPSVPDDLADQGYSWPSHGSSTLSNWITSKIGAPAPPDPNAHYPYSWGHPPDIQTMDHVALPPVPDYLADQGYSWPSHGSSTLSNWITSNIGASAPPDSNAHYPYNWGHPPDIHSTGSVALPPVPDYLAAQGYSWPSQGSPELSSWINSNLGQ